MDARVRELGVVRFPIIPSTPSLESRPFAATSFVQCCGPALPTERRLRTGLPQP